MVIVKGAKLPLSRCKPYVPNNNSLPSLTLRPEGIISPGGARPFLARHVLDHSQSLSAFIPSVAGGAKTGRMGVQVAAAPS